VDPVAKSFFEYLRNIIYFPTRATLDVDQLPEGFRDLGEGLKYLAECIFEAKKFAHDLSKGDLDSPLPSSGNEIAAPLKSLQSSLKHLSWQTQQVAQGDYKQRVHFMGDFSTAFNVMVQQLEERRKTDADEKSKLQRYVNLLLSNSPDIILLFDIDGQLVFTSTSYQRCCNIENPDTIRNKSFRELFAPVANNDFLQRMDALFQAAIAHEHSSELEQEIAFGRDGNLRHYRIQVTPMLDEHGAVVGTLLFFLDITERVRAQHEAERARELAEQAAHAKSEFLARMSHEMRTPMTAIMGMTAIAKASDDPERTASCLDKMSVASQHLLGVINDILDMSRLEADTLELSLSAFNFADMVQRVISRFHYRIEEQKQTLSVDIDGAIPVNIISDEQRLAQVITNLLSNAIKFTPEQGAISLSAEKIDERDGICTIRFTVKDTGIGVSEEQQQHLFVSFEQADGGFARKFGGTGLGLSIARGIVSALDGRIWVESAIGKGASFFFEIKAKTGGAALPVSPVAMSDGAVAQEERNGELGGMSSDVAYFAGRRVLVAEDVEINREVVSALLEDTGLEIVFAYDGAEAVAKFSAAPGEYDAILMDIHMPDVDGYEATKRIRSSGLQRADVVPIIAMTANIFREDIERCLAVGMNSHLGKPINIDKLVAELKKYLA